MPLLTFPSSGASPSSMGAKALVFEDPKSQARLRRIRQLGPSDVTVCISGEMGTGKATAARQLHALSRRAERPFVAVQCGVWSEPLIERELFGHDKGVYPGATGAKAGCLEAADGGTLFLDEIGDLPLSVQAKLLRALREREVVRIGSRQPIPIDVRLIAATSVNLDEAVSARKFREDLFFRLNVAAIAIPPLRERPGDVLPLARRFLDIHAQRLGVGGATLTAEAEQRLLAHPYPGNLRELENAIRHALLVCHGHQITASDLRLTPIAAKVAPEAQAAPSSLEDALLALFGQNLPNLYEHIEATMMRAAYRYCDRNQLQTARLLGISRNIVRARLAQCGELIAPRFRAVRSAAMHPSMGAAAGARGP